MGKFSIIVLLSILPAFGFAQDHKTNDECTSVTFNELISIDGRLLINNVKELPGGGFVIAGILRESNSINLFKSFLARLNDEGDLIWFKTFGFTSSIYSYCEVIKIVLTVDNAIMMLLNSDVIGEVLSVLKLDFSGNVIWKQSINTGSASGSFFAGKAANDGGLFFSANIGSNSLIGRMSSSGLLTWAKLFSNSEYMNANDILEDGNDLYFVGFDHGPGYIGSHIVKLNKSSGNMIWKKSYGKQPSGDYLVQFSDIDIYNGELIVNGVSNIGNAPNDQDQAVFTLDTSGNVISVMQYKLSGSSVSSGIFDYPTYSAKIKVGIQRTLIDSNAVCFFQIRNGQPQGFTRYIPGNKILRSMSSCADSGFIAGLTDHGYSGPTFWERGLLIKNNYEGSDLNCPYTSVSYTVLQPSLSVDNFACFSSIFTGIENCDIVEIPSPSVTIEKLCFTRSNCNLNGFMGADTVCVGNDENYLINISGTCTNPMFSLDTTFATIINTSGNSVNVHIKRHGVFYLIATLQTPCGQKSDSMAIHAFPSGYDVNIGPDLSLCPSNTKILNAHNGYFYYYWQDGSTDSIFTVTAPGIYWVDITDLCGNNFRDSVIVSAAPPVPLDLGTDQVLCRGDSATISAPLGFINYNWSPDYKINTTTARIVTLSPVVDTAYYLKAEKTPGCFAFDTIRIHLLPLPVINLGIDKEFCKGDTVHLDAGPGFTDYLWNTGSQSQTIIVTQAGAYSIKVQDNSPCYGKDTIWIIQKDCMYGFYIPSAFTPNGDGRNDLFRPLIFGNLIKYEFAIYNRWGQELFRTKDHTKGWNGKLSGFEQGSFVFVWFCNFQLEGTLPEKRKGTFILIKQ